MTDIVERLRDTAHGIRGEAYPMLFREAADEIERLRNYQDETAKAWTKLTETQEQEIELLRLEIDRLKAYAAPRP